MCGQVFQHPQSRSRHMWKCQGLRPRTCSECTYASYRLDKLKQHMKAKHGAHEHAYSQRLEEVLRCLSRQRLVSVHRAEVAEFPTAQTDLS
ncbi:hypothetical protein C0Q70_08943 [Pomacea canaliculata]|uniref:C2H2-type domain-containing protein n=1 Tax=Pomacea canaliculata TaxID=400727 RepID=A0A2T7P8E0_POMCA|nr:hypothetical protein C0Q70_08943 [Pomacea canaliculata]